MPAIGRKMARGIALITDFTYPFAPAKMMIVMMMMMMMMMMMTATIMMMMMVIIMILMGNMMMMLLMMAMIMIVMIVIMITFYVPVCTYCCMGIAITVSAALPNSLQTDE
jgi:hypothetical protein